MILAVSVVQAAKLYKVVDENGNVTFSQYPPVNPDKGSKVKDMSVSSGGITAIKTRNDAHYCGDIYLASTIKTRIKPNGLRDSYQDVDRKLVNWQDDLRRLEQRVSSRSQRKLDSSHNRYAYSRSSSNQTMANREYQARLLSDTERMRDLRCAIKWAKAENNSDKKEAVEKANSEHERLAAIQSRLRKDLREQCGELPKYDPDVAIKALRKEWYNCSKKLRGELKIVSNKMRQY